MDPILARLQRRMDIHFLPVDKDLATVMIVRAGKYRHQRGLTRTVSADQRMGRAALQGEVDVLQCVEAGKGDRDIAHLEA
ncbi:hypothetical protein D3C80_1287920 [compost metagenome]